MEKELFTISFNDETKEYILIINKDLIERFYTNVEDINDNIDFNLFNSFKNNIIGALEKGDKFQKLVKDKESNDNELDIPKKPLNQSFSSHDCTIIGKCPNPNCRAFPNSYMKKCQSCGQMLDWSK